METEHGIKKLTLKNWREPDKASAMYCGIYEDGIRTMDDNDWAALFMDIELSLTVPVEVMRLFETAKAALCYGWFYHSLYTLGMEQVSRVAETAVKFKCIEMGLYVEKQTFYATIKKLADRGIIQPDEEEYWHNLRELRNSGSHPDIQMILPPGVNITMVRGIARLISALFP